MRFREVLGVAARRVGLPAHPDARLTPPSIFVVCGAALLAVGAGAALAAAGAGVWACGIALGVRELARMRD